MPNNKTRRANEHSFSALDFLAMEKYRELTPENKEKINALIVQLKADQS